MQRLKRRHIRLPLDVYEAEGLVFSVTIGTSPRRSVFDDVDLGLACVESLRRLSRVSGTTVFAYCLMPDHVHLLVQVGRESLVSFVGRWKSSCYSERLVRGHADRFWQRSFFDHALRSSEALVGTARYILDNPVRAGLVGEYREYPLCGSFALDLT